MVPLSVVIITYNEERNIARCLDSIQNLADDIVVLDSFSTDKTAEICSGYKTNFVSRKWEGYSNSKNFANGLAANDWILSLDADEALSPELKKELLNLKSSGQMKTSSFNRLTNYCGTWIKHSGWYPDKKTRLFNRNKAKWVGEIHEELEIPFGEQVRHFDLDILHYSYYDLEDHLKQIEKFTNIAAKEIYQKGKKPAAFKMYLNAWAKFVSHYIIHAGFLDGKAGWTIARYSAYATYLKYKKARALFDHEG